MTPAELDRASGTARGIRLCIYEGDTDSLLRYQDNVPWTQLFMRDEFPNLVNNAGLHLNLEARTLARSKADAALSVLLGWAQRDGQHHAFALKDNAHGIFPEPVKGLIENGMTKSLAKFLDNGFDPNAKRGTEGLDAFQVAARLNQHAMAMVMVSHGARGRAHGLIAEMATPFLSRVTP